MFHDWWTDEKRADYTTPLEECRRSTKVDGMVFQRGPVIHQNVTFRRFKALVDLVTHETFGVDKVFLDAVFDGFVEFRLLAGMNQNVDQFKDQVVFLSVKEFILTLGADDCIKLTCQA